MSCETGKPTVVSIENSSWKPGDGISGRFPVGLRVLVVDDDKTCLRVLNCMLKKCGYEVTQKCDAESALDLLRNNKNGYDIVISDVHMPDMDGFKLLEHIGLEMDLPVIMMSADDRQDIVWKGVTHGACDYLIKPISIEALKNIWQHVIRKKKQELKEKDFEGSGISEDGDQQQKSPENVDYSSSENGTNCKTLKKKRGEEDEEDRDDTSAVKKPRVVWSNDLHQQFVNAVNQLGIDRAVPKKILELMDVPGLTRENVASHLQKFRLYLKKAAQHESLSSPFMGLQEAPHGSVSSINGLNLHALTSTGQIPSQSLGQIPPPRVTTFQGVALTRPISSMPIDDQRNIFRFETPSLHPFAHSSEGMNMQVNARGHMVQHQPQMTHTFNHINGVDHVSTLAGQPNLLQVIPSGVRGPAYATLPQPSTPPGNSFVSNYDDLGGVGNCANNIEPVSEDDFFSSYFKQQGGLGPVENEFNFEGYHTNNYQL